MEVIWAPWRMTYIRDTREEGCVLCRVAGEDRDQENLILHRGKLCFVIMNLFPYNNGHLMVAPYKHMASLAGMEEDDVLEMMEMTRRSVGILEREMRPHGFNIGMNLGRVAGAGIEDHIHMHIVPRWSGDTNFMPVIGETKVLPQHLSEAYSRLVTCFKKGED